MKSRNLNLDIVRIMAAFMVLSVHVCQHIGVDFSVGAKGVQLFFVISGYLAFASLENKSALFYYKTRLLRILPTYYFCLILLYLEDILLAIHDGTLMETLKGQCGPGFLRYVFFLQCIVPTDNWDMWSNHGALWTMSAFVGFYIMAPWLKKLVKNSYIGVGLVLFLLISRPWFINGIQYVFRNYPETAHIEWFSSMNPITELYCFMMGAVVYVTVKESKQFVYLLILLFILIATSLNLYSYEIIFTALLGICVMSEAVTNNSIAETVISWVSGGSFTLYLVHPLILAVENRIWYKFEIWNKVIHGMALYACSIAVSYLVYYGCIKRIEKALQRKVIRKEIGNVF